MLMIRNQNGQSEKEREQKDSQFKLIKLLEDAEIARRLMSRSVQLSEYTYLR